MKRKLYEGRRGRYLARAPYLARVKPKQNIRQKVLDEYNHLIHCEYEQLRTGKIWENDDELLKEYCKLFTELHEAIPQWKLTPKSRNNVVVNKHCCISWIQYFDGCLYVVQRSQDVRAKEWDYETLSIIANELKCHEIYWVEMKEHEYIDKSKIARRKHG